MFFRNEEMLDNAEDDDEDELVANDAAEGIATKIAKKSSDKTHAMKLFVKISETGLLHHCQEFDALRSRIGPSLSDDVKLDVVREVDTHAKKLLVAQQSVREKRETKNLPCEKDAPPALSAKLVKKSP
ncbi:unnamed protein product [Hyaloperonospora brassicae]|nr:unnamed protein product [Hyaloperonospora brassicae]